MTELEKLKEEFDEFKSMLLTPDLYLRYERMPQLVGTGIDHVAGSEEATVVEESTVQNIRVKEQGTLIATTGELDYEDGTANILWTVTDATTKATVEAEAELDRWEIDEPQASGNGINTLDINGGTSPVTILNVTETGRLIDIGLVITTTFVSYTTLALYLDITIDGGTTQSYQLMDAGVAFTTLKPWHVGTPHNFDTAGDSILIPFNLAYSTSLKVELRRTNSGTTGVLAARVHRGVKV